jgi:hypothetical protein
VKEKLRKRKEMMILENKRVCARGRGVKERPKREKISPGEGGGKHMLFSSIVNLHV